MKYFALIFLILFVFNGLGLDPRQESKGPHGEDSERYNKQEVC